jgi:hypothetical protein
VSTWLQQAQVEIENAVAGLPDNLEEHKRAIRNARIGMWCSTSWGRKQWAKARRMHLLRFDAFTPRNKDIARTPLLSPLERAKAKYDQATNNLGDRRHADQK